jgi:hypothetical protein
MGITFKGFYRETCCSKRFHKFTVIIKVSVCNCSKKKITHVNLVDMFLICLHDKFHVTD